MQKQNGQIVHAIPKADNPEPRVIILKNRTMTLLMDAGSLDKNAGLL
jgi:hypothetical protein